MNRVVVTVMAVVVLSVATISANAQNKGDVEKLHGVWIVTAAEWEGSEVKCDLKKGEKLIFDGKTFKFESKLYREEGTFSAEGTKKVKEINFLNTKDKKSEGIYELKGEEMELCYSHLARPTEFKSTRGVMLIKLRR